MALKNRTIGNPEGYDDQTEYDQQTASNNSTFDKFLVAGIAVAGGYGLYKSGLLKPIVHEIKTVAGKFADTTGSQAYNTNKALKNWLNNNTEDIIRPTKSIFNTNKDMTLGYALVKDLTESVKTGNLYSKNVRAIINDTTQDIKILNDMIAKQQRGISASEIEDITLKVYEELDGSPQEIIDKEIKKRTEEAINNAGEIIKNRSRSLKGASLFSSIKDINDVTRTMTNEGYTSEAIHFARSKMIDNFIEGQKLGEEDIQRQLKETGYRSIKFDDFIEGFAFDKETNRYAVQFKRAVDENGNYILQEDGSFVLDTKAKAILNNINFNEDISTGHTYMDELNNLFNKEITYNNKTDKLGNFKELWKNIKIDDAIQIDEKGNIVNYLESKKAFDNTISTLRRSFGLPVVGFNPINTIMNVVEEVSGKQAKERSAQFAMQSGNQYNAFITGKGTREGETINEFFQRTLNKADENFNILNVDGTVYAMGNQGTIERVGENFIAYETTGANKMFKVPHAVEAFREMGDYNLNKDGQSVSRKSFIDMIQETIDSEHTIFETSGKHFDPNMSISEYEDLIGRKLTRTEKTKYTIGRLFDIGAQEFIDPSDATKLDFNEATNIDKLFDDINEKIAHSNFFKTNGFEYENYQKMIDELKDKTYEQAFGQSFSDYINKSGQRKHTRSFVMMKKGIGFKDLIEDVQNAVTKEEGFNQFKKDAVTMVGQYFSGFDKDYNIGKYYTDKSGQFWGILNGLDRGMASIGLGLSNSSKRSTGELFKNLLLKRALPIFMLTQIPGMINFFSEPIFTSKEERERGETDNLGKTFMRNIVKPIDIGFHRFGDKTNLTNVFKYLNKMVPGSDQFNEMPGIYQLGLGQTEEERKDYIENGFQPMRKNRFWSASNTPFTGSKIEYWRPNLYRRVEADVKFSDTMYGSRWEYYSNTWYPNIVNPFAPLNHFIIDPNHYDKKHAKDRPYPVSASKGETIPLIGPLVSGTVGKLYSRKMHDEYWNEDGTLKPVNPEDEKPSTLLKIGVPENTFKRSKKDIDNTVKQAFYDRNTFESIKAKENIKKQKDIQVKTQDIKKTRDIMQKNYNALYPDNTFEGYYNSKIASNPDKAIYQYTNNLFSTAKEYKSPLQTSTLPYRDYNNKFDTSLDVYITPSGQTQVVDVPDNLNLYKVNKEIQHYSLNKIYGTNQRIDLNEYNAGETEEEPQEFTNSLSYSIGNEFNNMADVAGLKGFLVQALITGDANTNAVRPEDSSYTYSANRQFWNQNLGGFGGELSEIARRFIPKKDNNITYLNPIRNTMPTWLPGSRYFTDFLHGDPYAKITNGEERLPGEGYERLYNIDMSMYADASMLGNTAQQDILHFLHQDENTTFEQEQDRKLKKRASKQFNKNIISDEEKYDLGNYTKPEEIVDKITGPFREDKSTIENYSVENSKMMQLFVSRFKDDHILLANKYKFINKRLNVGGQVDAVIRDMHSRSGQSLINFRGVSEEEFNELQSHKTLRDQDYYEMNFDLYSTNNTKSNGYIYYYNAENPLNSDIYKARVKFNKHDLRHSIETLETSRETIKQGIASGEISRGDLYNLMDKYRILADVAPYSQEFKDISAQISHSNLTASQKKEASAIRKRMLAQKEPLRTYDYKFSTANLQSEEVTVKRIIDNETILVNEYGTEHAIKFAGIRVSQSNSTLYSPSVKTKKKVNKATGREVTVKTGDTMNEAARKELEKYIKPGQKITIQYDATNKFNKDSTQSIRAVIRSKGKNINKDLLDKGLATEKENDESPAGINARYSKGDIAFGSMMESITHNLAKLPIIGDKFFQVRSPYEQYRHREVYNKDFKSWNHPIRDFLVPTVEEQGSMNPVVGVTMGAFIGSLMGRNPYGKFVGALLGGSLAGGTQIVHAVGSTKDREWRPKRRRDQEELNTYIDTLKYVKNIRLYKKYSDLAKKQDHFDVEEYLKKHKEEGDQNKARTQELNNYKRLVKLDYKHRGNYNFKYGEPKYVKKDMDKKQTISAINRELSEISSDRKVEKIPLNAIKAISYQQASEKTMYGYDPGEDVRNIMASLPKKERQYYSKMVNAPEEEREKILRIAPSYLRRALQSSWGLHVDEKPDLTKYFTKHALPNENWVGWDENTNIEDVKVKMVNANGLDPGEFDIWEQNKEDADKVNIPIPKLRKRNNPTMIQARLNHILNNQGFNNVNVSYMSNSLGKDSTTFEIREDNRSNVEEKINNLEIN